MDRHEFMSPRWIGMARQEIASALEGRHLGDARFTLCEEFTDPPPHLRAEGDGAIGFCVRIDGGVVEVVGRPLRDADCRIVSDYGDALALARDPDAAAADPAEAERRIRAGRLRVEGDPSAMPPALAEVDLHRILAAHTL